MVCFVRLSEPLTWSDYNYVRMPPKIKMASKRLKTVDQLQNITIRKIGNSQI